MNTVLCVDDDPRLLEFYRRLLTEHGYRVLTANSGRSGIRMLRSHEVDLVITDILMPDGDGFEMIIATLNLPKVPPVIAVSGGGEYWIGRSILDMALAMGIHETLEKPVSGNDLLDAISRSLNKIVSRCAAVLAVVSTLSATR